MWRTSHSFRSRSLGSSSGVTSKERFSYDSSKKAAASAAVEAAAVDDGCAEAYRCLLPVPALDDEAADGLNAAADGFDCLLDCLFCGVLDLDCWSVAGASCETRRFQRWGARLNTSTKPKRLAAEVGDSPLPRATEPEPTASAVPSVECSSESEFRLGWRFGALRRGSGVTDCALESLTCRSSGTHARKKAYSSSILCNNQINIMSNDHRAELYVYLYA